MNKQILFAHSGGAQGNPGNGSYDFVEWLRRTLEREYHIHYPVIADPEAPTYAMWKAMFDAEFSTLKGDVALIGHSLGGSMLLKYLSEEKAGVGVQITGLFLVATPFWGKNGWNEDDFALRANYFQHLPVLPAIHLYHCINDPVVPFQHLECYRKHLSGAMIHELSCNDHAFTHGLPKLVENLKAL